MIPVLGVVRENTGPIAPTHHRKKWPILGRLLVASQLTSSQQQQLSVIFTDVRGNPAQVDGAPYWACDNTDILSVTPAPDGMSCLIAAIGPLGNVRVSVQADADMGNGVVPIAGVYDVEIVSGAATTVQIQGGAITDQPS